ncbi:MAG: ATP-binding protein [Leptospiraceae bacterium]|nr:ATP-binding protein [Leptospiraceae bacterium]
MKFGISPTISCLPLLVGIEKGIFRELKLNLELTPLVQFSSFEKKSLFQDMDGAEILYTNYLLNLENESNQTLSQLYPVRIQTFAKLAFYSPKNFMQTTVELKPGLISPVPHFQSPENIYLEKFMKRLFPKIVEPVTVVPSPFNLLEHSFYSNYSLGMVGDPLFAPFLTNVKNSYNVKDSKHIPYTLLAFKKDFLLRNYGHVNSLLIGINDAIQWMVSEPIEEVLELVEEGWSNLEFPIFFEMADLEKEIHSRGLKETFLCDDLSSVRKNLLELSSYTQLEHNNLEIKDNQLHLMMKYFQERKLSVTEEDPKQEIKTNNDSTNSKDSYLQELYRVLFKESHELLLIFNDRTLQIEDSNTKFRQELEYNNTEISKLLMSDLIVDLNDDHAIKQTINKREKTKYIQGVDVRHKVNGKILTMDVYLTKIKEGYEGKYIILFINSSERKDAMRLKHEFISNISHELRTPMTSIQGFFELLSSDSSINYTNEHISTLEIINKNIKKMNQLIDNLLLLEKKSSDRINKSTEKFDPAPVIEEIISINQPIAKEKDLEIEYKLANDIIIEANRLDFVQVMTNLIVNAIKYTEKGKISVKMAKEEVNNVCKIEIQDTGIGIDKKYFLSIFERFFRVPGVHSKKIGGTGIGLSVSQELLSNMGGIIMVESEVGVGSKFFVYLPYVRN